MTLMECIESEIHFQVGGQKYIRQPIRIFTTRTVAPSSLTTTKMARPQKKPRLSECTSAKRCQ